MINFIIFAKNRRLPYIFFENKLDKKALVNMFLFLIQFHMILDPYLRSTAYLYDSELDGC